MKLHRLALTNYRGIAHRDVEFPDHGVVVVCGANEIGKSSMVEALDLLLEYKDRSTKKEVKQVKPTNADVGSEVIAEISSGPYRFVYRKRFHKRCETELTVLAPRREQLTGDEAHERVRTMLAETVDTELWHAQRVLQAASTAAVDLSGCDALSRALDLAAGDDAALSGTESLLIERIEAEYARYFTPTGDGRVTNTLIAAGPGTPNQPDAHYHKIHLYDAFGFTESRTVAPGREPVVVVVDGVRVGLTVCYDIRFPALYTELARRGAQLIAVCASWGSGPGKLEQWTLLARARALDSMSYVAAAGQADPGDARTGVGASSAAPTGVGGSLVASPLGEVVVSAGTQPQLLVADIDVDNVAAARDRIAVLRNQTDFVQIDKAQSRG